MACLLFRGGEVTWQASSSISNRTLVRMWRVRTVQNQAHFLAFPCAATASMAFLTVSSSPRKDMGFKGFRLASSSYIMGIPVGRFSSMMAASDMPAEAENKEVSTHLYGIKQKPQSEKCTSVWLRTGTMSGLLYPSSPLTTRRSFTVTPTPPSLFTVCEEDMCVCTQEVVWSLVWAWTQHRTLLIPTFRALQVGRILSHFLLVNVQPLEIKVVTVTGTEPSVFRPCSVYRIHNCVCLFLSCSSSHENPVTPYFDGPWSFWRIFLFVHPNLF